MTQESTAVVTRESPRAVAVQQEFTSKQVNLLRRTIAQGTSDEELSLFVQVCRRRGLDPFAGQIYAVVRGQGNRKKMTIQTGIDGYRALAKRSGKYEGQTEPEFRAKGSTEWSTIWDEDEPPFEARVGVLKAGLRAPLYATAQWSSYVQTNRDGAPNNFWKQFPLVMLAKCAESLALRKAFPADLAGIYTNEEMSQAGGPTEQQLREGATLLAEAKEEVLGGEVVEDPSGPPEVLDDGAVHADFVDDGAPGNDPSADQGGPPRADDGPPPHTQAAVNETVDAIAEVAEVIEDSVQQIAAQQSGRRQVPEGYRLEATKIKTLPQFRSWSAGLGYDDDALMHLWAVDSIEQLQHMLRENGIAAAISRIVKAYEDAPESSEGSADPEGGESGRSSFLT